MNSTRNSRIRFHPTTNASNRTRANLKAPNGNENYSQLSNKYWNEMASVTRRAARVQHYNANAARKTAIAQERAAQGNTNMVNEIPREFIQYQHTPEEFGVYMNAVQRYGSNIARMHQHINASRLSNNSKRRVRNILKSNRVVKALKGPSNPRFIHPEWNQPRGNA
jgi:hypothetical protein